MNPNRWAFWSFIILAATILGGAFLSDYLHRQKVSTLDTKQQAFLAERVAAHRHMKMGTFDETQPLNHRQEDEPCTRP